MQEPFKTLAENFINSIPNLFSAALIIIVSYYGGVLLSRLLNRGLVRNKAEEGVTQLLTRTTKWVVFVLGLITALQKFFDVTAFLTGLGILGFTIGFALQNIMQNFVSGVILLLQQPFKVGDAASVAAHDGTVLKIGLRTTEIKTFDGLFVFLPNADILSQPIVNYTRAKLRRIQLPVGVAYDSDTELVRAVILNELQKVKGVLSDPAPQVLFHTFGGSSIDLDIFFWVDTTDPHISPFTAKDEALTLIKKAFEEKGIDIPFPIRTLLMPEKK
ncbi:MAG: mechanosensitive ion channel [Anaerolineales bacterium]|nr:mechanosensitive ion channel [Anaerolineales bacterium]MCB9112198.1 mechanosensitive ion channel [Anaerolineales bacterium]